MTKTGTKPSKQPQGPNTAKPPAEANHPPNKIVKKLMQNQASDFRNLCHLARWKSLAICFCSPVPTSINVALSFT